MANLRNTVVTGSLRLASHGAGMVRTDANGTISTAAMTAGDLPSHNHDDRYYTESEINSLLSAKQDAATAITTSNIGSQSVSYASSAGAVSGNQSSSFGLNDTKLYLRTNGDNNHYLWNAGDDWEELNAYEGTGFRITSNGGSVGILYVYGASNGGYTYSPYSFRAPIFYDSQDTTYYVDPNSTSNLAASYIGRVLINYDGTDTWFRMQSGNRMRVTTTGGNDFIIPNTGNITFNGTTLATREWVQAQGYRTTDSDNQTLSVSGTTLTISGGNSVTLPTGGISQGDADARYLRYTGAELVEGNYFYFRSNRGDYLGSLDSPPLQVYATGTNSAFMSFHRGGSYAVNFGLDRDNVMRIGGWSASSNRWVLDMSGNNTVAGSFRAPIFYDSENTGYYLDPASSGTSLYMNGGIVTTAPGGTILMKHAVSEVDAWIFQENAANWGIYWKNAPSGHHTFGGYTTVGAETFGMSAANVSGNGVLTSNFVGATSAYAQWMLSNYTGYIWSASTIFAAGDMRAPIFYDSNDTSFYLNPAGGSRLRNLYVGDSGSDWSDPGGWGTQFHVSNGPHSIIRVYARSEGIETIMYSHVGGQSKVGSGTNHDFAIVRNFSDRMTFYSGYTYANGYLQAADSLRAPIFYDSNDTSYYLDPNSTSRIASLQVNRHIDAVTGWGNASNVLFLNWDGRKVVLGNNNNGWHDLASALGQDQIITTNRHWFPQGIQPLNMGGSVLNLVTSNIGTASGNREAVTFIDGSQVQAHVSVGTGSGGNCYQWYNTEWLIVDPEKDYEFSVWVKSSGHHNIYVGWHELNSSWSQITSNPYFHTGTYNTQGGWIKIVAKLRNWRTSSPQGDGSADRWASTNSKTSYANDGVMHSSTRYVHLRMGTCYGDGSANKTYFHLVSVREITGHDQYAQSIAMPYFNGSQTAGTMYLRSQTHWDNYSGIDVIGGSGEFRISSDSGAMSVRVDGSFIASDNVYLGTRGVWLSDWLNQSLTTSSGPTFGNVYTSGWFRNYGQQGIYNQDYGVHFYAQNSSAWSITGSGGNVELQFRSNHNSTIRGYVYADTSNQIGFLHNGGGWNFRTTSDKNAFIHGQALTINADNAGWSSIYMNDGDEGMREIHCNSNRIGFLNQSGSWGSWCDDSGNWITNAGMYAAAFYDQDNSAYYGNFASTSRLNGIYADYIGIGQDINTSYRLITNGSIYLNSNGNGWAEGVWKQRRSGSTFYDVIDAGNIGSQSVSYASTSYIVNSTNDYRHSNRSPDSWHGLANSWHFNDSSTLGVSGSDYWTSVLTVVPWYGYASSHRQQQLNFGGSGGLAHRYAVSGDSWSGWSRIYSDAYRPYADSAGNADTVDGYHMNQAVTVNASPTFQEVYANGWFRSTGHQGHYNPTNGAHFYPNDNSYGAWKITGSRNGWGGINLQDPSGYNHYYMHESGNGGYLTHDRWAWYWHRGNNSLGLGESTTSSSYKVYVTGSLYATGDIVAYSDRRKKTDIVTIEDALSKVKEMRGVFYTKIDEAHKGRQVGVIAQEMNEVLPEAVTYAADVDEYGVKYGNIVGVLIEAIKEQQKQIEELKAKLI